MVRNFLNYGMVHSPHNSRNSDYNYVKQGDKCVSVGPEPIPAGVCAHDRKGTYLGSSGYRLIPGNTCTPPSHGAKDEKVEKDCAKGDCQPWFISIPAD